MDRPTFLRLLEMRGPQIMWFLGAGASVAAGIRSAGDMIWDFKRKLYCSMQGVPVSLVSDIGDPAVRRRIQTYLNDQHRFPALGTEDEYSAYFEATFPAARDRRSYIDEMVAGAVPSFGHRALALLMKEGVVRIVWQTNFDDLGENAAAAELGGVSRLTVADLSEPGKAARAISEGHWPLLVKLHGDYQSERLMNTSAELRLQDAEMRRNLVASCKQLGLAVVGYSGRDASVMDALEEAFDDGKGYPGGLFWFVRRGETPYARVTALIERAAALGIEARFIEIESFDELLCDATHYLPKTSGLLKDRPEITRPRRSAFPVRPPGKRYPVVRLAALPILSAPTTCRLAKCEIGGDAEVQEAAAKVRNAIDARRCRSGVMAFGRDADIRRAFEPYKLTGLDACALAAGRLRSESQQMALMRDALCRALGSRPNLQIMTQRRRRLAMADPKRVDPVVFNRGDSGALDKLSGMVPQTNVRWIEACELRLDSKLDRLWLLLDPTTFVAIKQDTPPHEERLAREFGRERWASRRNRPANSILDGWIQLLVGDAHSIRLRAFGISDGADADFEIGTTCAFGATAA